MCGSPTSFACTGERSETRATVCTCGWAVRGRGHQARAHQACGRAQLLSERGAPNCAPGDRHQVCAPRVLVVLPRAVPWVVPWVVPRVVPRVVLVLLLVGSGIARGLRLPQRRSRARCAAWSRRRRPTAGECVCVHICGVMCSGLLSGVRVEKE